MRGKDRQGSGDKSQENDEILEDEMGSDAFMATMYDDAPPPVMEKTVARLETVVNQNGTLKEILRAKKSDFVRNLIYLDGQKFDFTGRGYLKPIYDGGFKRILLKTARQVEKTTFLANNLTCTSVVMPYNKALYVSPSHTQTRQFSNEKLRPSIERSPLIKRYFQDSSVSTQVFEKGFTNGSYIFLRSAFRSADRCLVEGTAIYLSDGTAVKVEELQAGTEVVSFNGTKSVTRKVLGKTRNGRKECLELILESGHSLKASFDHRFFTAAGVKELQNIRKGDTIPIPLNYLEEEGDSSDPLPLWAGLLLGDGTIGKNSHCSTYRCQFNNNSLHLINVYRDLCDKLGLSHTTREREQYGKTNYTVKIIGQQSIVDMLQPLGIMGTTQFTKFIPERFFKSRSAIRSVLQGLIESDGWVTCNKRTRQVEIGFVSGSFALAKGAQRALQCLGIYSQLLHCQPKGRQVSPYWVVKIRHVRYVKIFHAQVGLISKQEKLEAAVDFINTELDERCYGTDVPARADCALALADKGISHHSLWENSRIQFRSHCKAGDRIAQQKVYRIWELTGDSRLEKWLDPSVAWAKVKAVVPAGVFETWDVEIEGDPYFAAEGVFTHNTRGISARVLCLDEIQDFLTTEIPVIMECTSHFPDASNLMAGTPKSHDNPIEVYWQSTTQGEWLVPCPHCGKWNFLDENNIGPTDWYVSKRLPPGPICKKCHKPINPATGQWVEFAPGNMIKGFRIPQLMVPWICGLHEQWLKLLWKRDNYPYGQFSNEVLGLSYDSASKPITRDELMDLCADYGFWNLTTPEGIRLAQAEAKKWQLTAGVDWGEGNDGSEKSPSGKIRSASYSVLSIGAYVTQKKWKLFYAKRYEGREVDPDFVVRDITRICQLLGVKLIGADWGHGWGVNNMLIRTLDRKSVV